jgi:hypothetical protein
VTVNTNEPAGALVIPDAAIRTEKLLADLTPAAVLPGKNPLTVALEFMGLRGINLVAVSIGFFELLGYHFINLNRLTNGITWNYMELYGIPSICQVNLL